MSASTSTQIFRPYMGLGLVCDGSTAGCRPCHHQLGLSHFLTTPVDAGRILHLYDVKLRLKGVSKPVPPSWLSSCQSTSFSHLAAHHNVTFAVVENLIVVFYRLVPFTVWQGHSSAIVCVSLIGGYLVTVDDEGNLFTWQLPETAKDLPSKTPVIVSRILLPPDFHVTSIVHPHTYVNKILLSARDGRTLLLNLSTKKIIHIFKPFSSRITTMEPSPIVDVVAVGTVDGIVHLHNFRTDKTLFSVRHLQSTYESELDQNVKSNAVQAMSFRTDGVETLGTTDSTGNLFIWDLNEKRLSSEARRVHRNGVIFAHFLPGEPLLVTTGVVDNAIKIHIFDESNESVRLLRSREGHYLPPTKVRFCGHDGLSMVSAGLDREIRLVCAVHEARNRTFSQKTRDTRGRKAKQTERRQEHLEIGDRGSDLNRTLPPVVDIASTESRAKDSEFANIVTVHDGRGEAYSWRMMTGASHRHVLKPPLKPISVELAFKRERAGPPRKKKKLEIREETASPKTGKCVGLSPCGNFAFVGFSDGRLHSFNLQSGLHQGIFDELDDGTYRNSSLKEWGIAHDGGVQTVCVDGCGEMIASAGSTDRQIKFWGMQSRTLVGEQIDTPGNVSKMVWCQTSDLLGAVIDDFSVLVYDVPTRKLARSFKGHQGMVVDICFDSNGRRLITASMDGTIRTWDLPSGAVFNVLKCVDPPTSVSICPNGEYLASTHSNSLSIRLWVNCERFDGKKGSKLLRVHDLDEFIESEDDETAIESEHSEKSSLIDETLEKETNGSSDVPLSDDILTLSGRPSNVWTVLSHLKEVQDRNKPVAPVKKGANAPFFLPTVKGLQFKFDTSEVNETEPTKSKIVDVSDAGDFEISELGRLLKNDKWTEAEALLKNGDASTVDGEIRTLSEESNIVLCAKFFSAALGKPDCFELTQAHLQVFLTCHGNTLAAHYEGEEVLRELLEKQKTSWSRLRSSFTSVTSLSSFFSGQV